MILKAIIRFLIYSLVFIFVYKNTEGITVLESAETSELVALLAIPALLALFDSFIRPPLSIILKPLFLLTLGIGAFVFQFFVIYFADMFVDVIEITIPMMIVITLVLTLVRVIVR